MNRIKLLIFLAILLTMASSCDPEFNYDIKGSVKTENIELEGAKVTYEFMPNLNQSLREDGILTDSKGKFVISKRTRAFVFDSLKIVISKEGYESLTKISYKENWNREFGINKKDYTQSVKPIELTKLDSTKFCEIGKAKALEEFSKNNYIHHEFLRIGTRDRKYWDKFEKLLNQKGINLKTVPIFKYPFPSNNQYMYECYLTETKMNLQYKYGNNWLAKLKANL